jgi:hypothetical protein
MNRAELVKNCPFELSEADKAILVLTDEEFVPHTWEDVKQVVGKSSYTQWRRSHLDANKCLCGEESFNTSAYAI